jgi:Spy/CpxP family protein refolding chaperone
MMRRAWSVMLVAAALCASAVGSSASAQGGRGQGGGGGGRPRAQLRDSGEIANQQALVRKVRQAFGGVVRRRLNLNDDQWKRFDRVDRQFQRQRNQLRQQERQTRLALRAAMQDTVNIDQTKMAKISQYLDELTQGQRRRADLLEAEQKQLSEFLTPLQRAKLEALRENFERRVAQLQQQGSGAGAVRR